MTSESLLWSRTRGEEHKTLRDQIEASSEAANGDARATLESLSLRSPSERETGRSLDVSLCGGRKMSERVEKAEIERGRGGLGEKAASRSWPFLSVFRLRFAGRLRDVRYKD